MSSDVESETETTSSQSYMDSNEPYFTKEHVDAIRSFVYIHQKLETLKKETSALNSQKRQATAILINLLKERHKKRLVIDEHTKIELQMQVKKKSPSTKQLMTVFQNVLDGESDADTSARIRSKMNMLLKDYENTTVAENLALETQSSS